MQGNKARFLQQLCVRQSWQFTRFDYRGHGRSDGDFVACNLDHWVEDTCNVIDQVCTGAQVLVGSSMGAWIALNAIRARPERICALLGIAAAPDFTESLLWEKLSTEQRTSLQDGRHYTLPSATDQTQAYLISMELIESGRRHRVLEQELAIDCPIRLLHGTADADVPYALSCQLLHCIRSNNITLTLKKNTDHRFSDPASLMLIEQSLHELRAQGAMFTAK